MNNVRHRAQGEDYFRRGQYAKALREYSAITEESNLKQFNIATCLCEIGTEESLRKAKTIFESIAETKEFPVDNMLSAVTKLGKILEDSGRHKECMEIIIRASKFIPDHPVLLYNIGRQYARAGLNQLALQYLERARAMSNDSVDLYLEINQALKFRDPEKSKEILLEGLEHIKDPASRAKLHKEIGTLYSFGNTPDYARCLEHYNMALMPPDDRFFNATIYMNIGNIHMKCCDIDRGTDCYLKGIMLDPNSSLLLDNYAMCVLYHPEYNEEEVWKQMKFIGERYTKIHRFSTKPLYKPRSHQLKRIGYVSGDMIGDHPVARFARVLFSAGNYEVVCYINQQDHIVIKGTPPSEKVKYRGIKNLSTKQACDLVVQDEIDILIDLSGHTSDNRLDIFCNRVAPVQLTYIGFPFMVGIDTIDYFVGDSVIRPKISELLEKKFITLGSGCYTFYIPTKVPGTGLSSPFFTRDDGVITIGAFNKPNKTNRQVREAFYRILKETENTVIIVKEKAIAEMAAKECPEVSDRISVLGYIGDYNAFLESYNRIDFALDTFPWTGTTTTCEALLMGAPVITLKGETYHSKSSASIIQHSFRYAEDWIAQDVNEYVAKTVDLVKKFRDRQVSPTYKEIIRSTFVSGPIMSGKEEFVDRYNSTLLDLFDHR